MVFFASERLRCWLVSWGLALIPGLPGAAEGGRRANQGPHLSGRGIYALRVCSLGYACEAGRVQRWRSALGLAALALLFLANIFFVVTGRTALLVAPVLLLMLGWREFRWKGLARRGVGRRGCECLPIWYGSPYLRNKLMTSVEELQAYRMTGISAELDGPAHGVFAKVVIVRRDCADLRPRHRLDSPSSFATPRSAGSGASVD